MLRADFMPRSHHATLEQRERGLNTVRVNVALGIDMELVANRLVASIGSQFFGCAPVCSPVVRIKALNILADILANVLLKRSAANILGMKEAKIAATLPDADYDFLVVMRSGVAAPVALFAAYKGFVHFYFAVQQGAIHFYHCCADAMAQVPRGLVGLNSERALNLASRHSLFSFANQYGSEKPSSKRQVGIVEDGVSGYAELVLA